MSWEVETDRTQWCAQGFVKNRAIVCKKKSFASVVHSVTFLINPIQNCLMDIFHPESSYHTNTPDTYMLLPD